MSASPHPPSSRGLLWVERHLGVMSTKASGHLDVELVRRHTSASLEVYGQQTAVAHFFDFAELTGYDTQARIELTQFMLAQRSHVASAHFLVHGQLVATAIGTAALAARVVGMRIAVTTDPAVYAAQFRAAITAQRSAASPVLHGLPSPPTSPRSM